MSIKPSVVFIKGVHSTTGHDQSSDIGFPQLGLEKLFEGATIKVTEDETYNSSKKYIYYDSLSNQIAIQDAGHFNCIKNGYYSIVNGIDHYYTKSGNNYNYNAVPDVSTWAGKWSFRKAIEGKTLYSISPEVDRICIGSSYYEKKDGDYVRQDILTYNTYNNSLLVSWDESNKYIAKNKIVKDPDTGERQTVKSWQTNDTTIAKSGHYLSVDQRSDDNYIVQLFNLTFDETGVLSDNTINGTLYKLSDDFSFQDNESYYIKNNNSFEELRTNQGQCTFTIDPTTDNNFYIYQKGTDWSYPNTKGPEYSILARTDSIYDSSSFPLYTGAAVTEILKTRHASYIIYEKTAVKINYNYSNTDNSLKFIFTDKTVSEVLNACSLPDNIGLEKYVHLTNLEYRDK